MSRKGPCGRGWGEEQEQWASHGGGGGWQQDRWSSMARQVQQEHYKFPSFEEMNIASREQAAASRPSQDGPGRTSETRIRKTDQDLAALQEKWAVFQKEMQSSFDKERQRFLEKEQKLREEKDEHQANPYSALAELRNVIAEDEDMVETEEPEFFEDVQAEWDAFTKEVQEDDSAGISGILEAALRANTKAKNAPRADTRTPCRRAQEPPHRSPAATTTPAEHKKAENKPT